MASKKTKTKAAVDQLAAMPNGEPDRLTMAHVGALAEHPANRPFSKARASFRELVESIRTKGVIVPLIVRPGAYGAKGYQILAGHRRAAAASVAGPSVVTCRV